MRLSAWPTLGSDVDFPGYVPVGGSTAAGVFSGNFPAAILTGVGAERTLACRSTTEARAPGSVLNAGQ
jgi:hypothetical protein